MNNLIVAWVNKPPEAIELLVQKITQTIIAEDKKQALRIQKIIYARRNQSQLLRQHVRLGSTTEA